MTRRLWFPLVARRRSASRPRWRSASGSSSGWSGSAASSPRSRRASPPRRWRSPPRPTRRATATCPSRLTGRARRRGGCGSLTTDAGRARASGSSRRSRPGDRASSSTWASSPRTRGRPRAGRARSTVTRQPPLAGRDRRLHARADPAQGLWFARDVAGMADALGTEPVLVVAREVAGRRRPAPAGRHRRHPQRPPRLRDHLVRARRRLGGDDSAGARSGVSGAGSGVRDGRCATSRPGARPRRWRFEAGDDDRPRRATAGSTSPRPCPSCAADEIAALAGPPLRGGGVPGHAPLRRRRLRRRDAPPADRRGLCGLRPCRPRAARAARRRTTSCSSCSTGRRSPSRTWRCSSSGSSSRRCWRGRASASPSSAPPRATPARPRSRRSGASPSVDVFILYPHGRVSEVQRRQMTTPAEANVHALAIDGDFDDCQAALKAMFADRGLRATRCGSPAVNSINWARVLAQVVYYFTAAVALGAPHRPVSFTVPTGNFGDIYAGLIARRMGLPIERLVVATNPNDILHRTLRLGRAPQGGRRRPRSARRWTSRSPPTSSARCSTPTAATAAPSPRCMAELRDEGGFALGQGALGRAARGLRLGPRLGGGDRAPPSPASLRDDGRARSARTPPWACTWPRSILGPHVPMVTLATAHPAKFPDAVEAATGHPPAPSRRAWPTCMTARSG